MELQSRETAMAWATLLARLLLLLLASIAGLLDSLVRAQRFNLCFQRKRVRLLRVSVKLKHSRERERVRLRRRAFCV